jgi:hypothetical protein
MISSGLAHSLGNYRQHHHTIKRKNRKIAHEGEFICDDAFF